jgi:hypothetical protein
MNNELEGLMEFLDLLDPENKGKASPEDLKGMIALLEILDEALEGLEKATDEHKHECSECGFVWNHRRSDIQDELYDLAHTCLQCGSEQKMKYHGEAESKCRYDGTQTEWVGVEWKPVQRIQAG